MGFDRKGQVHRSNGDRRLLTREEIEEKEESLLAPYAMKSRESRGRVYPQEEDPIRTRYQRDRDRIIHSTAFRRLEYKTQVFVNHEGDYYRTRLTHTIEVAQIARTMARALRLNEDLTEAISLAHDIGHTPFGHSGEEALHELMDGKGGFEHNHQGLRVVDLLEHRYPDFKGLNLTYETREGIIKHRTPYDLPDLSELEEFMPQKSPTLEAQIVNLADEIAYTSHDLDDGLKAGYLNLSDLQGVELWREIYDGIDQGIGEEKRIRISVRTLIGSQITDLIETTNGRLSELPVDSVDKVRDEPILVSFSGQMAKKDKELKGFLLNNLYCHYKVIKMADKAKRYIKDLFSTYLKNLRQLPPDFQKLTDEWMPERVVCDYIAGMTDRYAQDEYTRLFIPYAKM